MLKALTVAFVIAALAVTGAQGPVSIAILRQDGYLIPVATIDGSNYRPLLATSTLLENTNVFTAAAVALGQATWAVARRSGDSLTVTTLNRAMVSDHCSTEEAWRTSFKGEPASEASMDVTKLGIAVMGTEASQPEDVTSLPDEASRRVSRIAFLAAAAAETERLAKEPNLLGDFLPADAAKAALVVKKLFRHSRAGVTTYFFEVAKDPMPLVTSGWIVDKGGEASLREASFTIADDSYKEGAKGTVTGLVPMADRTLWLMEWHGYEGETHAIHDWPSGLVRLRTPGVGC